MGSIVEYRTGSLNVNDGNYEDTNRNFSPNLWYDLPDVSDDIWAIEKDDFINLPNLNADQSIRKYATFGGEGSSSILPIPSEDDAAGIMRMLSSAGDESLAFALGGSAGSFVWVKNAAGEKTPFVWETRFRASAVAANNIFIGLAGEGLDSTDGTWSAADPPVFAAANPSLLGFRVAEADPDGLDVVSSGSSGENVIQEVTASTGAVMTASTWVKVGMRFDGTTFRYYINGVEVASETIGSTAATTHPDFSTGEGLTFMISSKNGGAVNVDFDWLGYAVQRLGV